MSLPHLPTAKDIKKYRNICLVHLGGVQEPPDLLENIPESVLVYAIVPPDVPLPLQGVLFAKLSLQLNKRLHAVSLGAGEPEAQLCFLLGHLIANIPAGWRIFLCALDKISEAAVSMAEQFGIQAKFRTLKYLLKGRAKSYLLGGVVSSEDGAATAVDSVSAANEPDATETTAVSGRKKRKQVEPSPVERDSSRISGREGPEPSDDRPPAALPRATPQHAANPDVSQIKESASSALAAYTPHAQRLAEAAPETARGEGGRADRGGPSRGEQRNAQGGLQQDNSEDVDVSRYFQLAAKLNANSRWRKGFISGAVDTDAWKRLLLRDGFQIFVLPPVDQKHERKAALDNFYGASGRCVLISSERKKVRHMSRYGPLVFLDVSAAPTPEAHTALPLDDAREPRPTRRSSHTSRNSGSTASAAPPRRPAQPVWDGVGFMPRPWKRYRGR